MIDRLRSFASRVMTSCVRPSATPWATASSPPVVNGSTASAERRETTQDGTMASSSGPAAGVSAATVATGAGAPCDVIALHIRLSPAGGRPSSAKSRSAAATCERASAIRPPRIRWSSRQRCASRSKGARSSHCSSGDSNAPESGGSAATRVLRISIRHAANLRRWAVSQRSAGAPDRSSPPRNSPRNHADSAANRSAEGASSLSIIRTSSASTRQPSRSMPISSSPERTLMRSGSSTTCRSLLRCQRSSARGSFGRSHKRSQSRVRLTGRPSVTRMASSARSLRDRARGTGAPFRRTSTGPSRRISSPAPGVVSTGRIVSTAVPTSPPTYRTMN